MRTQKTKELIAEKSGVQTILQMPNSQNPHRANKQALQANNYRCRFARLTAAEESINEGAVL